MSGNFKRGFVWSLGAFVGFFVLSVFIGALFAVMEHLTDTNHRWEWQQPDQDSLEIGSYTQRIQNDQGLPSKLVISGELTGELPAETRDKEHAVGVSAVIRNPEGVVLTDCEEYLRYEVLKLRDTKSFVLECMPAVDLDKVGTVDFTIRIGWR